MVGVLFLSLPLSRQGRNQGYSLRVREGVRRRWGVKKNGRSSRGVKGQVPGLGKMQ